MDNPIWAYIFGLPKELQSMNKLLQALPVFEGLSKNELLQIERILYQRHYAVNEIVFGEGMPGAGMYIVKEGEVVIKKNIEGGEGVELAVIREKSFFGELALLVEMPRSASAYAQKDSLLLAFGKPDLEKLNDRNPKLALKIVNNIARLVCQRLVKANDNLELLQNKLNELKNRQKTDEVQIDS